MASCISIPNHHQEKKLTTDIDNRSQGRKAIDIAKEEVAKESLEKSVKTLKHKLRELKAAKTVVANIEREIVDLEDAITQGNA